MAVKATTATQAPRGTKTLTQAFFMAADSIAEAQRPEVVKAALAAIRDQLKEVQEKAKAAKAKAKMKAGKASVGRPPKAVVAVAKKTTPPVSKAVKMKAKKKPKVKSAAPMVEAEPDMDAE